MRYSGKRKNWAALGNGCCAATKRDSKKAFPGLDPGREPGSKGRALRTRGRRRGQEDRPGRTFPRPGHGRLLVADHGRRRPEEGRRAVRLPHRFWRSAPGNDGQDRHCPRRAGDFRARRADRARHADRGAQGQELERFPRRRNPEASRPIFRFRPPRHAGPESRRRRVGTLHARSEILRRHDQRPYPWPLSRRSRQFSVLGAGASLGRGDLFASRRPDDAAAGAGRLQGAGAPDVGLGRGNRLTCAAADRQRAVRALPQS